MKRSCLLLCLLAIQLASAQMVMDIFDIARKGTAAQAIEAVKKQPNIFDSVNQDQYTPLILACYRGNTEVVQVILNNKVDVDKNSPMGTALMAATVKSNPAIVKLLLAHKADPNIYDVNQNSALLYAVMFKNYEIAKLLIQAKADVQHQDLRKHNAIDYALLANDDPMFEILKSQ